MFLIFLIKNICLLALYFTYANMAFVDSVYSPRLVIFFIILVSLSLTYIFRNKKYTKFKYLPFIGFIIAMLFSKTVAGGLVVLVPFVYMIYLVSDNKKYTKFKYLLFIGFVIAILFSRNIVEVIVILIPFICMLCFVINKKQHYEDYYNFKDLFITLLIASVILLIFVFLRNKIELFYKTGLLYTIIFFISGLYLLRTMRHGEDIIIDKKFLCMNLLMIIMICITSILFSTEVVLNSLISGLKFIYIKTIIPIIAQVFHIVFTPVGRIVDSTIVSKYEGMLVKPEMREESYIVEYTEQPDITAFYVLTVILVSIVFIFLIYLLIKRIMKRIGKTKISKVTDSIIQNTSFLNDDIKKNETKHSFFKTNRIRSWYKKFLELCHKNGMYIFIYDNSQTIYNKSSMIFKNHDKDLENIKEIYRKARYDKDIVDKQNIKAIKNSYKSLEKGK